MVKVQSNKEGKIEIIIEDCFGQRMLFITEEEFKKIKKLISVYPHEVAIENVKIKQEGEKMWVIIDNPPDAQKRLFVTEEQLREILLK